MTDLVQYLAECSTGIPDSHVPDHCTRCGARRKLHRHGKFHRMVFTCCMEAKVPFFRFCCPDPSCRKAVTLIPLFVERHQQAAIDVKQTVMEQWEDTAHEQVAAQTAAFPGGAWSSKTLQRWANRWETRLLALQVFLWAWCLSRFPSLPVPKERGSLWKGWFLYWGTIRDIVHAWSHVLFLHLLLLHSRSLKLTDSGPHPTKAVRS